VTGMFIIDMPLPDPYRFRMPRIPRSTLDGECCHVLNRGNNRSEVFLKDGDYESFLKALAHACVEVPMTVMGYCLMPIISTSSFNPRASAI